MINGDIIFMTPWSGALYPKKQEDSSLKHTMKHVFGSKAAVGFSGADKGWYCAECKKIVAILNTDK